MWVSCSYELGSAAQRPVGYENARTPLAEGPTLSPVHIPPASGSAHSPNADLPQAEHLEERLRLMELANAQLSEQMLQVYLEKATLTWSLEYHTCMCLCTCICILLTVVVLLETARFIFLTIEACPTGPARAHDAQ